MLVRVICRCLFVLVKFWQQVFRSSGKQLRELLVWELLGYLQKYMYNDMKGFLESIVEILLGRENMTKLPCGS